MTTRTGILSLGLSVVGAVLPEERLLFGVEEGLSEPEDQDEEGQQQQEGDVVVGMIVDMTTTMIMVKITMITVIDIGRVVKLNEITPTSEVTVTAITMIVIIMMIGLTTEGLDLLIVTEDLDHVREAQRGRPSLGVEAEIEHTEAGVQAEVRAEAPAPGGTQGQGQDHHHLLLQFRMNLRRNWKM